MALADTIFRSSFLLQNFKLPFIQEIPDSISSVNCFCVAEICWYSATDEGLVNVRPMVELRGNDSKIKSYHELRSLASNSTLTDTDIVEMVLDKDWPSKLKTRHEQKVEDVTS